MRWPVYVLAALVLTSCGQEESDQMESHTGPVPAPPVEEIREHVKEEVLGDLSRQPGAVAFCDQAFSYSESYPIFHCEVMWGPNQWESQPWVRLDYLWEGEYDGFEDRTMGRIMEQCATSSISARAEQIPQCSHE